ncbi:MAG: hypothetical protein P4N24_11855 [Acidobacteriota bacterium]|nr:hypothetical protein [Acidobacteriota bacterium]
MAYRLKLFALIIVGIVLVTFPGCGGMNSSGGTPSPTPIHNEWTWESGASTLNQAGVYGTQGVPSPSDTPGARVSPCSWTDVAGNFWLFGGYATETYVGEGDRNDLWKFTPASGEWTWMGGSNTFEQPGTYGTRATPATGNVPGARFEAACWTDLSGNFWLFGGSGIDSAGTRGELNDLWRYAGGEWTWMNGSNVAGKLGIAGAWQGAGVYGIKGVADPANAPGVRGWASTWTDRSGSLWLFGGGGVDSKGTGGPLNDLWKYSAGEWTWMAGSNIADQNGQPQLGVYGTLGVSSPSNTPGARFGAATWTDANGDFWLFAGDGADAYGRCGDTAPPCNLNDLWRYGNGEWTWMGGPDVNNQPGVYGTQGAAGADNIPPPRNNATSWIDAAGNFWLFGGSGWSWDYNDLWKYSGGKWTWVSGSNQTSQTGIYGTQGTPAAGNIPGARWGDAGWIDESGNLWLFGGISLWDSPNGKFNDLWKYQP